MYESLLTQIATQLSFTPEQSKDLVLRFQRLATKKIATLFLERLSMMEPKDEASLAKLRSLCKTVVEETDEKSSKVALEILMGNLSEEERGNYVFMSQMCAFLDLVEAITADSPAEEQQIVSQCLASNPDFVSSFKSYRDQLEASK